MEHQYAKVLEALDSKAMIRFIQDIVRIDSVYDPERPDANESRVTAYIADFLKKDGFEVHLDEVVPGRTNIVAFLRGDPEGKTLLMEGHQDVVSIGNRDDWHYDPFGAEIVERDGRHIMYGRGTNDTKGNMGAAIFAARAIRDSGIALKGNVLLCIPVDEEGMMIGIKHFIKQGWAKNVDGALICEQEEKNLCIFQKGALRFEVTFHGTQCHGCMPLTGNDPNWALARFIVELRALENFEKDRLGKHKYLGWPSFTPTVVKAPIVGVGQLNVVPKDASVVIDVRTQCQANVTKQFANRSRVLWTVLQHSLLQATSVFQRRLKNLTIAPGPKFRGITRWFVPQLVPTAM